MKNIKVLYILSIMLIIVTGTMCTSCTADEQPQQITNNINLIPDQLEGYYISPNHSISTVSITEDQMILKFYPYKEEVIDFMTETVYYTSTDKSFTVHYYDGVDIIFEYIKDSDDITIVYNDNGVIYEFGQYSKQ